MIFQRALRRELLSAASAVFTTLFTITITFMLIKILGQAAGGKVASADVIALIGFAVLNYLPILFILTSFIAVLLVVTRSYRDSEMVVWFTSGVSLTQWIMPILRFGMPIILLTAVLGFLVTPWANQQSAEFRERYEKRSDIAKVSPGKFQESASSDRIFFVEEVAGDLSKVQNIFINTIKNGRSSIVVAKEGRIDVDARGDRFLVMHNGSRYDGLPTEPNFQMIQFEKYGVVVSNQSKVDAGNKSAKALPISALLSDLNSYNLGELFWRISLPLMCLVLLLLAVPLGFVNPRVGRSANLIIALLLVMVYLNMINVVQAGIVQSKLSLASAWWPVHAAALVLVMLLFLWRLKINSRWHPMVLWGQIQCSLRRKGKPA